MKSNEKFTASRPFTLNFIPDSFNGILHFQIISLSKYIQDLYIDCRPTKICNVRQSIEYFTKKAMNHRKI